MTATPEVDSHSAATSIRNPATGAVAGQVRWTDPADVARIAAGLREAEFLHAVIRMVGNIDVACRIDRDAYRLVELPLR